MSLLIHHESLSHSQYQLPRSLRGELSKKPHQANDGILGPVQALVTGQSRQKIKKKNFNLIKTPASFIYCHLCFLYCKRHYYRIVNQTDYCIILFSAPLISRILLMRLQHDPAQSLLISASFSCGSVIAHLHTVIWRLIQLQS